ncbi:MAG: hypothetical protein D6797_09530, partial [Bdellovibrio sp.]
MKAKVRVYSGWVMVVLFWGSYSVKAQEVNLCSEVLVPEKVTFERREEGELNARTLYRRELEQTSYSSEEENLRLFSIMKDESLPQVQRQKAREKLIINNLKLVTYIVERDFRPTSESEKMDYIQAGNVGLILAVDHFHPDRGVVFSSYASKAIKRQIQEQMGKRLAVSIDVSRKNIIMGLYR